MRTNFAKLFPSRRFQLTDSAEKTATHPGCQFQTDKTWLNLQFYDDGTIKKPDELEKGMRDPSECSKSRILDRVHGSMIGMALGDTLGAFVEFRAHEYMVASAVNDQAENSTRDLRKGQVTDDISMALCLANSLVARQDYVLYDQLVRYKWWHKHGYMSSTGSRLDIDSTTKKSLVEFEHRQKEFAKKHKLPLNQLDLLSDSKFLKQFPIPYSEENMASKGILMRFTPVPLFFYRHPPVAVKYSGESGKITHGDPKTYDACRYYGALIVAAVNGATKDELLDKQFYEKHKKWFANKSLHPKVLSIAHGSYQREGYTEDIPGKGSVVSALEAALWGFWSDDGSFEKGIHAVVKLGDDMDATAAIYGQLAGAYYGFEKLPEEWVEQVYAKDFIKCLSKWIAYEGFRWLPEGSHSSTIRSMIIPPLVGHISKPPIEQKTKFNLQSTSKKNRKDELILPKKASSVKLGSFSKSEQFTDHDANYKQRRNSIIGATLNFESDLHQQSASIRPKSLKYSPSKQTSSQMCTT